MLLQAQPPAGVAAKTSAKLQFSPDGGFLASLLAGGGAAIYAIPSQQQVSLFLQQQQLQQPPGQEQQQQQAVQQQQTKAQQQKQQAQQQAQYPAEQQEQQQLLMPVSPILLIDPPLELSADARDVPCAHAEIMWKSEGREQEGLCFYVWWPGLNLLQRYSNVRTQQHSTGAAAAAGVQGATAVTWTLPYPISCACRLTSGGRGRGQDDGFLALGCRDGTVALLDELQGEVHGLCRRSDAFRQPPTFLSQPVPHAPCCRLFFTFLLLLCVASNRLFCKQQDAYTLSE